MILHGRTGRDKVDATKDWLKKSGHPVKYLITSRISYMGG